MMRVENLGVIDIFNLQEKQERVLSEFFAKNANQPHFAAGVEYQIQIADAPDNITYSFKFSCDLIQRNRKNNAIGKRIEVINTNDLLGTGGFGLVFRSAGTLISKSNGHILFKKKPRAIKKQLHDRDKPTSNAEYEYSMTTMTSHIHAKAPVFDPPLTDKSNTAPTSYLTMKLMPGKNLHQLLEDEENDLLKISTDERIELTISVLSAIVTQIHTNHLIHRDIKPENIIYDPASNEVNIIDLQHAISNIDNQKAAQTNSTPIFQPIEQFNMLNQKECFNPSTDSFASGKMLAEVWGAKFDIKGTYLTLKKLAESDTAFDYSNFFGDGLTPKHKNKIANTLEQLTRAKQTDRLPIKSALETFELIRLERLLERAADKVETKNAIRQGYQDAVNMRNNWLISHKQPAKLQHLLNKYISDKTDESPEAVSLFARMLGIPMLYGCQSRKDMLAVIKQENDRLLHYQNYARRVLTIYKNNENPISRQCELAIDILTPLVEKAKVFTGSFDELHHLNEKFKSALFLLDPLQNSNERNNAYTLMSELTKGVKLHFSRNSISDVEQLKISIKYVILEYIAVVGNRNPNIPQIKAILPMLNVVNGEYGTCEELKTAIRNLPDSSSGMKVLYSREYPHLFNQVLDVLEQTNTAANESQEVSTRSFNSLSM